MTAKSAEDALDTLTVRAVGPATYAGRISLSELARIASGLQATLERVGFSIVSGRRRVGRLPREIAEAVRLDFVGFREGSAVLELQRPSQDIADDLLSDSFAALAKGLEELSEDPAVLPKYFDLPIVNGLVTLCGGISKRNVNRIEFFSGDRLRFVLDSGMRTSLKRTQKMSSQQEITVVGRLHMGDFDPMSLRCRIDTHAGSITCDLDDELKETVFDLLNELVMASGVAELQPDALTVRVLHLAEISRIQTAQSRSLDSLAEEQGVQPLDSIGQLRGEDIEGFDEFLRIIQSAR
jgi:hypothetical protein